MATARSACGGTTSTTPHSSVSWLTSPPVDRVTGTGTNSRLVGSGVDTSTDAPACFPAGRGILFVGQPADAALRVWPEPTGRAVAYPAANPRWRSIEHVERPDRKL